AQPRRGVAEPRDRQAEGLRHARRGTVLRALRLPRRGAAATVTDRVGAGASVATTHVEGIAEDCVRTLSEWIERYERRYEQAVAHAGEERARVWRLYLHAARQGFTTGWASIYQV